MQATGLEALKACGVPIAKIADDLGITRGAIYQWDRIPAERIGDITRITGLAPHIQRPDLFTQPQVSAAADGDDLQSPPLPSGIITAPVAHSPSRATGADIPEFSGVAAE